MSKFVNSSVMDAFLNAIKNGATKMLLIKAYTFGDSYATVVGNKLAEATMTSADFTLATSGNNRTLTTAAKSATAVAAAAALVADTLATSGTTTTLTLTGAGWTVNAFTNKMLTIISGTGAGQEAKITSNTATVLTFPAMTTAPDSTSHFRVNEDLYVAFTDGAANVLWVTDETSEQAVSVSDTINFPAFVYTQIQPT
jgi:hypothetical protein